MMKETILIDIERNVQTSLPTVRYYEISKLLGDASVIKSDIIEPLKESLPKDPFPHHDLDSLEIDASQLFEIKIRKPQKPESGLLVFKNFTLFTEMKTVDEQISTLSHILFIRRQYGPGSFGEMSSGCRVVFNENTTDNDKTWPKSCISFFLTKVV